MTDYFPNWMKQYQNVDYIVHVNAMVSCFVSTIFCCRNIILLTFLCAFFVEIKPLWIQLTIEMHAACGFSKSPSASDMTQTKHEAMWNLRREVLFLHFWCKRIALQRQNSTFYKLGSNPLFMLALTLHNECDMTGHFMFY